MSSQQEEIDRKVLVNKPALEFEAKNGEKIRLVSEEDEKFLDERYDEILNYMREKHDQNTTSEEKDKLYGELIAMWSEVSGKKRGRLNEISFNLILHRDECKYLTDLLRTKSEYTVDTVFYAMELDAMVSDLLANSKFENDLEAKSINMTTVDLHYLYHIISKHTVKGLGKGTYTFASIITRIGESSRVFNYFKTRYDALHAAISYWGASLDTGIMLDMNDPSYLFIWGDCENKPIFSNPQPQPVVNGEVLEGRN